MHTREKQAQPAGMTDSDFHVVDARSWPRVTMHLTRAPVHDDEIDAFQRMFTAVLRMARDGTPVVPPAKVFIRMNLDGLVDATLPHKLRAATFISDVREYVASSIEATALVVTSEMARAVLEFIIQLQPLTSVHAVFADNATADAWLEECQARVRAGLLPVEPTQSAAADSGSA
jgi:hypothetical protein